MHIPICTVLLISYNHAKFIKQAIESILSQKTDYEYIIKIFDDVSTDGTQEIIKEYAKNYPDKIVPFLNEQNQGAQKNILRAYQSVDTKYCMLLETDDYWCNDRKLQLQIDALEKHPECSFCGHNTKLININDKYRKRENKKLLVCNVKIKELNLKIININDIRKLKYGYMNHLSSRLVRTSCIDLENIKNVEDFLYDNCQFYYLLLKGDMYYIDKVMTIYNMNSGGSFSGAKINKKIRIHLKNLLTLNKNTDYEIEDIIYRHLGQFLNFWFFTNDNVEQNNFIQTLQKIKRYFIPKFILDILDIPRDIIRLIRKLKK